MIKVCHMTSAHQTTDVRILRKECVSLANAGYDVWLVGRGESREDGGVHVVGIGEPSGGRLSRMTRFARKVYETALELDCDLYHFHDPELLPYGLKLKRRGKKVIFDSHELYSQQIRTKTYLRGLQIPVAWLYDRLECEATRKFDAVIVVTPSMQKHFRLPIGSVPVISNFPVLNREQFTAEKREGSICFAGGIDPQWNHHNFITAMEKIPDAHYELCGPVSGDAYLRALESLPAWNRVNFLGRVPFQRAQEAIHGSKIGVALLSPSGNSDGRNGTMGNTKLFEIMMAGLPVVCTDFVLWKAIIDKYHCGLCIDPENVEAIANAIRYLLEHPEEARQMGANGRRAVEQEFNWGVEERKLLALYEEVT